MSCAANYKLKQLNLLLTPIIILAHYTSELLKILDYITKIIVNKKTIFFQDNIN